MPLTTSNRGKYLTRRWNELRAQAIEDRTRFSAEMIDWLELSPSDGWGEFNKENFQATTQPIDPLTSPKLYDIRTRPECGDTDLTEAPGGGGALTSGGYIAAVYCDETFADDK